MAVQYYTVLVAVEDTEPCAFTTKRVFYQLGHTDDILIDSDTVLIKACYFSTLMMMSICQFLWQCVDVIPTQTCPQGNLMFYLFR